jgi:hypothetical protein
MNEPRRVFLQLWGPTREGLIANHEFYVREAKRRLVDQFDEGTMKAEADRLADEWLEQRAPYFDPDRHDPADMYERAYEESIAFYLSLTALRDNTRLSIIAGMLHEWEKQFRDWLGRELGLNRFGKAMHDAVWGAKIDDLFEFMLACGWAIVEQPYFHDLKICSLVVNVYKHGNGRSLEELRKIAPEHVTRGELPAFFVSALDFSALSVSNDDIDKFAAAIGAFWRDLPENIYFDQVAEPPKWVQRALFKEADRT